MSFLDSYDGAFEKLKDLTTHNLSEDCTEEEKFYKSQKELRANKIVVSAKEEKVFDSGIIILHCCVPAYKLLMHFYVHNYYFFSMCSSFTY